MFNLWKWPRKVLADFSGNAGKLDLTKTWVSSFMKPSPSHSSSSYGKAVRN